MFGGCIFHPKTSGIRRDRFYRIVFLYKFSLPQKWTEHSGKMAISFAYSCLFILCQVFFFIFVSKWRRHFAGVLQAFHKQMFSGSRQFYQSGTCPMNIKVSASMEKYKQYHHHHHHHLHIYLHIYIHHHHHHNHQIIKESETAEVPSYSCKSTSISMSGC